MTHDELVQRAAKWLRNSAKVPYHHNPDKRQDAHCRTVLTEQCGGSEIPDAIGWFHGSGSILIECKASRSDFLADRKKPHRRYGFSLGDYRYYMSPRNLLKKEEIPDGWGLLEATPHKTFVTKMPTRRESDPSRKLLEMRMLWSELSLIQEAMEGRQLIETPRGKRIMEWLKTT